MPADEFAKSAEDGNLENVQSVIKQGTLKPDGKKACAALIAAASGNQTDVCLALLEWGVPADSVDDEKKRPIHGAVAKGNAQVVEELVQRKADITVRDGDGSTPLALAVNRKYLEICKILLSAGAQLTGSESLPGLATVVREVQVEKLGAELKEIALTTEPCLDEIQEADTMVWKAQREHMRLLELREEQKTGNAIVVLERQIKEESTVFKQARTHEDALARELQTLRVTLQTVETSHGVLMQQLAAAEDQARQAMLEEAEADSEYKAMMSQLTKAQSERDECERLFAEKEKNRDSENTLAKGLQDEIATMTLRNHTLASELKTESAQLRGWERDKEFAAELTAQAQLVLSPKKSKGVELSSAESPEEPPVEPLAA